MNPMVDWANPTALPLTVVVASSRVTLLHG